MSGFAGFSVAALDFYDDLQSDNSKAFWSAHKDVWETQVRDPMLALLAELAPDFGDGTVFRPYRDVRFSKDKSPYKTHQGGFAEVQPGTGFYVQLDASGLMAGGGFHAHTPSQVDRFRRSVDVDPSGRALVTIVDSLSDEGFAIGGETLKTKPRGYGDDHPRIDLLRHKTLTAGHHFGTPSWLHTRETLDRVRVAWSALRPLNEWIAEYVGPPDETRRRR